MFGDLMGDMQAKQEALQKELALVEINAEAGDGAVKVTVSATRQLLNVSIAKSVMDAGDAEELEDLLLVAINRAMELAAEEEARSSQSLLKDMLPPGMGDMGGMF